jgi:carbonic anhydrase
MKKASFTQTLIKGPDVWPHLSEWPNCAGNRQSPININDNEAEYDSSLTEINFINYEKSTNWNCTHNGHTGKVSLF